jgi:hypothetical protein
VTTLLDAAVTNVMTTLDAAQTAGGEIDVALIDATIEYVLSSPVFQSVDAVELRRRVEMSVYVWMREATALDDNTDHKPWYPARVPDWRFWKRYRRYLIARQQWAPEVVQRIDDITDQILQRLEDPRDTTRGL